MPVSGPDARAFVIRPAGNCVPSVTKALQTQSAEPFRELTSRARIARNGAFSRAVSDRGADSRRGCSSMVEQQPSKLNSCSFTTPHGISISFKSLDLTAFLAHTVSTRLSRAQSNCVPIPCQDSPISPSEPSPKGCTSMPACLPLESGSARGGRPGSSLRERTGPRSR
jgi:hypothetical protein